MPPTMSITACEYLLCARTVKLSLSLHQSGPRPVLWIPRGSSRVLDREGQKENIIDDSAPLGNVATVGLKDATLRFMRGCSSRATAGSRASFGSTERATANYHQCPPRAQDGKMERNVKCRQARRRMTRYYREHPREYCERETAAPESGIEVSEHE